MTAEVFATVSAVEGRDVGPRRATSVWLHVPRVGAWYADVDLEDNAALSGRVVIRVGSREFRGTVDPRYSGEGIGLSRRVRVVAGAGAWSSSVAARGYHSDGGVRALLVAQDAARDAGETLGTFSPGASSVGRDFGRRAGAASLALEAAAGGAPWWVGYDGVTNVGERAAVRPQSPADVQSSAYEVLEFDPLARVATISADDVAVIGIGSVIPASERLPEELTVRELTITVAEVVRVRAWAGGDDGSRGRIADAFRAAVRKELGGRIYGPQRYRVGQMSGERYELQPVRTDRGLPNLSPLSAFPGVAGSHSKVNPPSGTEVLVEFVDGDPGEPVVVAFAGIDGVGWLPLEAVLAASQLVRLGSATADKALALAQRTNDNLEALRSAFSDHAHPFGSLVCTGGTVSGATGNGPNVSPLADVGSSVVMGVE